MREIRLEVLEYSDLEPMAYEDRRSIRLYVDGKEVPDVRSVSINAHNCFHPLNLAEHELDGDVHVDIPVRLNIDYFFPI